MNRLRIGSMLLEALVAVTLAVLALAGVSQLLVTAGRQQRAMEWRQLANREAANAMEQVMVRTYEQMTEDQLSTITLSPATQERLRSPQLNFKVTQIDNSLATKQIEVEIGWENIAGRPETIRLVAWKSSAEN